MLLTEVMQNNQDDETRIKRWGCLPLLVGEEKKIKENSSEGTSTKPLPASKAHKVVLVSTNEQAIKDFFKQLCFFNKENSEGDFPDKLKDMMRFFVRRSLVKRLTAAGEDLKENHSLYPDLQKVRKLERLIDSPLEGRGVSNEKIVRYKDHIYALLRSKTFLKKSRALAQYKGCLGENFMPSFDLVVELQGLNDGITADWGPVEVKLGSSEVPFLFFDFLSENINFFVPTLPPHDMIVIVIEAIDFKDSHFKKILLNYRTQIAACMRPRGPTLSFVITNLHELETGCRNSDHLAELLREGTQVILKVLVQCSEKSGRFDGKLPMIMALDLKDKNRFQKCLVRMSNLFMGERVYKTKDQGR